MALERALVDTRAVLVIVDPLSAYLGSRDSYKDAEIRGILAPLAALAERLSVAGVAVLHLTKDAQRRLLHRAQGSIAFVAAARTVLAVGEDPDAPERRLFVAIKSNLGPLPPALAFRIDDQGLGWESAPVEGVADRLLAADLPGSRSERRERDEASASCTGCLPAARFHHGKWRPTPRPTASRSGPSGAPRPTWVCSRRRADLKTEDPGLVLVTKAGP